MDSFIERQLILFVGYFIFIEFYGFIMYMVCNAEGRGIGKGLMLNGFSFALIVRIGYLILVLVDISILYIVDSYNIEVRAANL